MPQKAVDEAIALDILEAQERRRTWQRSRRRDDDESPLPDTLRRE